MGSGYDNICSDILYLHLQQITIREQRGTLNHRNAFKDNVKSTVKRFISLFCYHKMAFQIFLNSSSYTLIHEHLSYSIRPMLSKLGYLWQYFQFTKQKLCDSAVIYHGAYLIRLKVYWTLLFLEYPINPFTAVILSAVRSIRFNVDK
jgi:hypothetical protein